MSKNKKNESKGAVATVTAAVVAAVVRTMDGIECAVETALALSRDALVAYKKAVDERSPIAALLDNAIATYNARGPDAFAFASAESPRAKVLVEVLKSVRVKGDIKLFIPLTEARAQRAAYLEARGIKMEEAKKTAEQKAAEAKALVEATNKQRAEERAQRVVKEAAAVEALGFLVDKEVVADREAKRMTEKDLHALRVDFFRSIISPSGDPLTMAVQNDHGWLEAIRYTKSNGEVEKIKVWNFQDLLSHGDVQRVEKTEDILFSCQGCGNEHKLGDQWEWKGDNRPTKKDGKPAFLGKLSQVGVYAMRDKDHGWIWTRGEDQGKLKPIFLIVCHECVKVAKATAPRYRDDKGKERSDLWVKGLWEPYDSWYQTEMAKAAGQIATQPTGEYAANGDPILADRPVSTLKAPRFSAEQMAEAAAAVESGSKTE